MGPLIERPRRIGGRRLALLLSVSLNLVLLGLLLGRQAPPLPAPGTSPGPGTPAPAAGTPAPAASTPAPGTPLPAAPAPSATPPPVAIGPFLPFATPTPLTYVLNTGGKMRGVNIPVWGPDFTVAAPSIRAAPALGGNWVSLVSTWYVRSAVPITDGVIFREEGAADGGLERTASAASLGAAVDAAHAQGLKVMLKPHVDWTAGGWRGSFYFTPGDSPGRQQWWRSYHALISDTVTLALAHHADAICIGTEFADINKEAASAAEWIHVVDQIRAMGYYGPLTYAANWGLGADAEYNRPGLAGVWDLLDFVGVDAYYPLSPDRDPALPALLAGWHTPLNPWDRGPYAELEALHKRTGKPVIFTEIGYPALDYGAKNPCCQAGGPDNEALQSRAVEAAYQVWQDVPWWGGAFWWQYGPSYNSLSLQGRPALDTLHQVWIAESRQARP